MEEAVKQLVLQVPSLVVLAYIVWASHQQTSQLTNKGLDALDRNTQALSNLRVALRQLLKNDDDSGD